MSNMSYNGLLDSMVVAFLFICLFSPIFTWFFSFLAHSLVRFNINSLKRKSTPEEFQEYMDKYNWKYSVEFFYPQLMTVRGVRKLRKSPIYLTQVSKFDAEVFENWLLKNDDSDLEIKNNQGSIIKINRNSISSQRIRIESIPIKLKTNECLYAIYEEDDKLLYTFEEKQNNSDSKPNSKSWLIALICAIIIPPSRLVILCFSLSYFIWNSYNMTYLFKNYPLCNIRKLPKKENADFFKK
jgi:hypothetical protein